MRQPTGSPARLRYAVLAIAGLLITACATGGGTSSEQEVNSGPPVPEAPLPTTRQLIGYDTAQARGEFGAPGLKRSDRGAEIWQYPTAECTLFLFFYDSPGGDLEVSHVEAIPVGAGERPVAAELGQFLDDCVATAARKHRAAQPPQS